MADYNYSIPKSQDSARAVGRSLPISTKAAIEVCSMIRYRPVDWAMTALEEVLLFKRAVPYRRAFKDVGHRTGMAAGRFPQRTTKHVLELVKSVRANAESRGLNAKSLVISHVSAQQGGVVQRGGRHGRTAKRTHVEIVVKEAKEEKKQKKKQEKPEVKGALS